MRDSVGVLFAFPPFWLLAYFLVAAASGDFLSELEEVNGSFVELGDLEDRVALLAVELAELVEVIEVCPGLALHRIKALNPSFEAEDLCVWEEEGWQVNRKRNWNMKKRT